MNLDFKITKEDFRKRIVDSYDKVFSSSEMKKFMEFLADHIRKRVRSGYGADKDKGPKYPLSKYKLSEPYVKFREGLEGGFQSKSKKKKKPKKRNSSNIKLSEFTTPKKSNLTLTGQMLEAITGDSKSTGIGEVYFKDVRKEGGIGNNELAVINDISRPFFKVTDYEYDKLLKLMEKKLNQYLRSKIR